MITLIKDNLEINVLKKGAEVKSFKINGKEFLWNKEEFWNKTSPILFPFIGKLKDNSYKYNGRLYNMSKHGFARDMNFELVEKTDSSILFKLDYNKETLKIYPFKFILYVEYKLLENGFKILYKVENVDNKKMFFQIGSHPAFVIDEDFEKNSYIEFEKEENSKRISLDDNGFLLEKVDFFESLLDRKNISILDKYFDNDTLIFDDIKSSSLKIKNRNNKSEIKVSFEKFPYLALWKMKKAPYICIENWYGVNEFLKERISIENRNSMQILEPNNYFEASLLFEFKEGE